MESAGDWRSFRAQLIQSYEKGGESQAQGEEGPPPPEESVGEEETLAPSTSSLWAHDIGNRPEKGCLIVAKPEAFLQNQRYFHEAVIFLVDYSPTKGAVGLILNRPTQFTLEAISYDITSGEEGEGDEGNPTAEETRAMREQDELEQEGNSEANVHIPEFLRENRVYFGGDVKSVSSTLMAMHPFNEDIIPGAQKVVDGVYCNGKWFELGEDSGPAVALDAQKYKFFAQYAGWGPGQLERELETNEVWVAAACAPELVLKQVIQLPKPLWREVLELMGGEYAIMSKQQYGEL
jgi:putative transcriptional regulator